MTCKCCSNGTFVDKHDSCVICGHKGHAHHTWSTVYLDARNKGESVTVARYKADLWESERREGRDS